MAKKIKMIALKTFDAGFEGFQEKGAAFEVERQDRAEALAAAGLAEVAETKKTTKADKAAAAE